MCENRYNPKNTIWGECEICKLRARIDRLENEIESIAATVSPFLTSSDEDIGKAIADEMNRRKRLIERVVHQTTKGRSYDSWEEVVSDAIKKISLAQQMEDAYVRHVGR